jgi:hypothetical protein
MQGYCVGSVQYEFLEPHRDFVFTAIEQNIGEGITSLVALLLYIHTYDSALSAFRI